MKKALPPAAGPMLEDALAAGTTELWLMRVPRHSVLRKSLVGKTIAVGDASAPNMVRGNYRFSDVGESAAALSILPTPVGAGSDGKSHYVISRRFHFARQVDVRFTGSAMVPVARSRGTRTYPAPPDDDRMLGRYRPIGLGESPLDGGEEMDLSITSRDVMSSGDANSSESQGTKKKKKLHQSGDGISKKRKKRSEFVSG